MQSEDPTYVGNVFQIVEYKAGARTNLYFGLEPVPNSGQTGTMSLPSVTELADFLVRSNDGALVTYRTFEGREVSVLRAVEGLGSSSVSIRTGLNEAQLEELAVELSERIGK